MLKRARGNKWSFLVIRGAEHHVKQFRVSKRSVVAAPAAAVLAVSGCITGLQLRSAAELRQAKEEMATQSAAFAQTVQAKDQSLARLQQELARLKKQAAEMQTKLSDLQELETKLRQFTEAYGAAVQPEGPVNATQDGAAESASYSADSEARALVKLAAENNLDFRAVTSLVDTMSATMAESMRKERLRRAELAALPSGWPTESRLLTSGFGYRTDPFTGRSMFHAGIDIGGDVGDPIFAAAAGEVLEAGYDAARGNYIVIGHRNGLKSAYFHLHRIAVKEGESVKRGEQIGLLGSTGRSTGAHLHFQIMQEDKPINPFKYLRLVKED
jgi:murein DD-endopeptidase MepM/ murein hydrolase activator NlpD